MIKSQRRYQWIFVPQVPHIKVWSNIDSVKTAQQAICKVQNVYL